MQKRSFGITKDGKEVVHNKFGSNMLPGILSLLISNCKLDGTIKGDALIVEVDERYTKQIRIMIKGQKLFLLAF